MPTHCPPKRLNNHARRSTSTHSSSVLMYRKIPHTSTRPFFPVLFVAPMSFDFVKIKYIIQNIVLFLVPFSQHPRPHCVEKGELWWL